ncbi:hypothetical protein Ahy_B10g105099 [Arachis hypogaea]|uniref:Uncharacterized protein n=1 Tax=Arachis hypogaea TaxID=3818 RepID=A0A444X789_ARAHY|nr:hypothetical protein Ahy_B10g105099 [Arachis hypogaea]
MNYFKKKFEFDYAASTEILAANPSDIPPVEWAAFVDHYMDYPKTKKQCLQNTKNHEKLIVSHVSGSKSNARRATQMYYYTISIKLARKIGKACMLKQGYYFNFDIERWELCKGGRTTVSRKLAEHLPEDKECAAAEGIHSKVLAHPDDAIEKETEAATLRPTIVAEPSKPSPLRESPPLLLLHVRGREAVR